MGSRHDLGSRVAFIEGLIDVNALLEERSVNDQVSRGISPVIVQVDMDVLLPGVDVVNLRWGLLLARG